MTDPDRVLEECLKLLASGQLTIEQCLERDPRHAAKLSRALQAAGWLQSSADLSMPVAARNKGARALAAHMATHPRRQARTIWRLPAYRQWAPALAALALCLTAGTALAQTAGPTDLLYGWRLASESAWLSLSPAPEATALAVAERRAQDLLRTVAAGEQTGPALSAYQDWLARLQSSNMVTDRMAQALAAHQAAFQASGIELTGPELDGSSEDTLPAGTPLPNTLPLPSPVLEGLDGLPLP
jgi:hypothetical protein